MPVAAWPLFIAVRGRTKKKRSCTAAAKLARGAAVLAQAGLIRLGGPTVKVATQRQGGRADRRGVGHGELNSPLRSPPSLRRRSLFFAYHGLWPRALPAPQWVLAASITASFY
ncbi:hypothetical protein OH686_18330 [Pseudomonas sp. SO81]|nr:hypothetical protein OH686_18330 [Pseudomonas sp. SO81]